MGKIILVEDDSDLQDAMKLMLEQWGCEVSIYSSGNDLLNYQFELPDLIILDKQLAGIDGLDICQKLKENIATKDIPVVMISASPQISKFAKHAGADGFLEKPFKMQELRDLVDKYLGQH